MKTAKERRADRLMRRTIDEFCDNPAVTEEQIYNKANKNIFIARQFEGLQLKISHYNKALGYLEKIIDRYEPAVELHKATEAEKYVEFRKDVLNTEQQIEAKAEAAKADWQCKQVIKELEALDHQIDINPIPEEYDDEESKAKLAVCGKNSKYYEEMQNKLKQIAKNDRMFRIASYAIVIALILAFAGFYRSSYKNISIAKLADLAGHPGFAKNQLKSLYEKDPDNEANAERLANFAYEKGMKYFNEGNMSRARTFLHTAAELDYKDSRDQYTEIERLDMQDVNVGDIVTFARQKWIVLEKNGTQLKLLKNELLVEESVPFTGTWDTSQTREYLNNTYFEHYFYQQEVDMLVKNQVAASSNKVTGAQGGQATEDLCYLMSAEEVAQYADLIKKPAASEWYLRTPGADGQVGCFVTTSNGVVTSVTGENPDTIYLRPVITVDVK